MPPFMQSQAMKNKLQDIKLNLIVRVFRRLVNFPAGNSEREPKSHTFAINGRYTEAVYGRVSLREKGRPDMKRLLMICLCAALLLACSAAAGEGAAYPDGIYRGFYYDGGIEQIAIQFEIRGGVFDSIVYRGVKYKDGDYMIEDASDAQKGTLRQYRQLADYLIGKGVEAIDDLYSPYDIVDNVDAVTTATMQSSKLISALWDGLNRRPYKLVDTTKLPAAGEYQDGLYRGSYMEDGGEEVALEFVLRDGCFEEIHYRTLQYKGDDYLAAAPDTAIGQIAGQFDALLAYLVGKDVTSVNDLYRPGEIAPDVDGFTGASLRAPKVISAIWDGLGRHAYHIEDSY